MRPPWYTWALSRIGVREIVGPEHNGTVVNFWKLGDVALEVKDDETPWCAAFANAALVQTGYVGTRSGRARSFTADGRRFVGCDRRLGAIVVLSSSRGPASGHVGFLAGTEAGKVHLLGGNQGNQVCIAPFPESKVIATLWPANLPFAEYDMAPHMAGGKPVTDG